MLENSTQGSILEKPYLKSQCRYLDMLLDGICDLILESNTINGMILVDLKER